MMLNFPHLPITITNVFAREPISFLLTDSCPVDLHAWIHFACKHLR